MKKFFLIMFDEFKSFLNDKGLILILVAGVIAYSFCYAHTYHYETSKDLPVGVIDMDGTDFSREFIRKVDATTGIYIREDYSWQKDAEESFFNGRIKAFIVIPKNFEEDLAKGKQVNVSFYADNSNLIIYKTIYTALFNTVSDIAAKIEMGEFLYYGLSRSQAKIVKSAFEFVQVPLFNAISGYKSYVYPIILILIFHQTLILGLGLRQGTRNEKKEKYCANNDDLPISIFAKTTVYVLLYIIYAAVGFLMFPQIFNYPMYYNVIPLAIMYILMMYAAAFFAQTISYFFKMRETAMLIMVPCSIIFIFMTGLIWPREAIPKFISLIFFFVPSTCGIDGIIKINQNGASFYNVMCDFWWLLFLCVLYFITAIFVTKKLDKSFEDNK